MATLMLMVSAHAGGGADEQLKAGDSVLGLQGVNLQHRLDAVLQQLTVREKVHEKGDVKTGQPPLGQDGHLFW